MSLVLQAARPAAGSDKADAAVLGGDDAKRVGELLRLHSEQVPQRHVSRASAWMPCAGRAGGLGSQGTRGAARSAR